MEPEPTENIEDVIRAAGRYPLEAYQFLYRGLDYTARRLHGEPTEAEHSRHVSGQQLCEGLRAYAIEQYGRLARHVLERWNVRRTRDFGEMVYFLISHQHMSKQDTDRIEDFDDVFDFASAFDGYEIPLDAVDE